MVVVRDAIVVVEEPVVVKCHLADGSPSVAF